MHGKDGPYLIFGAKVVLDVDRPFLDEFTGVCVANIGSVQVLHHVMFPECGFGYQVPLFDQ